MSSRILKLRGNNNVTPQRKQAPGVLLKTFLSEFLSPSQIASLDVNWEKDYGMDNEVLRVFEEANKLSREGRKFMPFAWFKEFDKYLATADILALVGCVQLPDTVVDKPHLRSKIEKIRTEIYKAQQKIKQKPKPDTNILPILDYLLATTIEKHRHFELVSYNMIDGKVESVLDKAIELVPKTDGKGPPGPREHIVSVQRKLCSVYVISPDLFKYLPALQPFFESEIGSRKFYVSFISYLSSHFPNMQDKMLDKVNMFTNRYFEWMNSCVCFESYLAPEVAWKYTPLSPPLCFRGMPSCKMVLRLVTSKEDGVGKRMFFFLDEARFVFHQLRRMGIPTHGVNLTPPTLDAPSPVTHKIAEISSIHHFSGLMCNVFPSFLDHVEILEVDMNSSALTNFNAYPIVSPYNSHCIRALDAFKRLVDILIGEVGVGRRIPFTFHPLATLMKKMDAMFLTGSMFKMMVNRKEAHELIQEAANMRGKFNGKLKTPKGRLGLLPADAMEKERMDAFLATFRRYSWFYKRHLEEPQNNTCSPSVPPGEPSLVTIFNYLANGTEQEDDANAV